MRRNRIIWLCIWILSLITISFFGGPISYSFFAFATFVPITSALYLVLVYFLFHIYQKIDSKVLVAGQKVPFYFTLMNDYYFIFSGISVKLYSTFSSISDIDESVEYELFSNTGITKETSLVCKYRGEYNVGIKTVVIQDYLRLFCVSYHNREPLCVTVRPKLVSLEKLKNVELSAIVSEANVSATEPDVLVRSYVPGDDIRYIHWGISAKNSELMVRTKTGEKQQGIGVVMSTKRYDNSQSVYLPIENKMLEIALCLSMYFAKEGIDVLHVHRSIELEMRQLHNMDQFDEYYDFVSKVSFNERREDELLVNDVQQIQSLHECRVVFFILHEWSDAISKLVYSLNKSNVFVMVYLISDSIDKEVLAYKIPKVEIVNINPQDDLTEVL